MGEQDMATGKRLTRGYEQSRNMGGVTDPDWALFRAQLSTELAPRSLRDRLLVEAIETIAERAFYAGQEVVCWLPRLSAPFTASAMSDQAALRYAWWRPPKTGNAVTAAAMPTASFPFTPGSGTC